MQGPAYMSLQPLYAKIVAGEPSIMAFDYATDIRFQPLRCQRMSRP